MTINEKQSREEHVLAVARAMMAAARTAPKARGIDNLEIVTVSGRELERLAARMESLGEELGYGFFSRDAGNVLASQAVVLIGTKIEPVGLDCGQCGYPVCGDKPGKVPCAFNTGDMGIAVGSAVSLAADNRIDTRIMFSAGKTAAELGLIAGCQSVLAILMSCTGKSPFFDRIR